MYSLSLFTTLFVKYLFFYLRIEAEKHSIAPQLTLPVLLYVREVLSNFNRKLTIKTVHTNNTTVHIKNGHLFSSQIKFEIDVASTILNRSISIQHHLTNYKHSYYMSKK